MPPPLELECLRVLWNLGSGTVHEVLPFVSPERPLAYTTVMTLLDRLVKRNAATRRKRGRSYIYQPKTTRQTLQAIGVKQLSEALFDASEAALLEYLQARVPETPSPQPPPNGDSAPPESFSQPDRDLLDPPGAEDAATDANTPNRTE